MTSSGSCFGTRPKVPMKGHEGGGEIDEVRILGKSEQMGGRKKQEELLLKQGGCTEQQPEDVGGDGDRRGLV